MDDDTQVRVKKICRKSKIREAGLEFVDRGVDGGGGVGECDKVTKVRCSRYSYGKHGYH
jgi:hypothetical protein